MPRLHFIERLAAVLVVIATFVAVALGRQTLAAGLAVGGVLSILNFYVLRLLMRGITSSEHPPRQAMLSLILMLKFALMGMAIFILINYAHIDPTGLLIGLTVTVMSILAGGFRVAIRGDATAHE
ncbi:MAG: ATP synthase subunit I [Deltaproteobacteria bacterium]|nr:ATP synthase subunit I [Deltaproteobacteria bacterium]